MTRTTRPPSIKITPMAWMFTYCGVQVIANRRIAPMMISAMLPPMVTGPPVLSRATPGHASRVTPRARSGYRHSPGRFWHPRWPPGTQWSLASPLVGGHGGGVTGILGCVDPLAPLRSVGGRLAPPMEALAQSIAERAVGLVVGAVDVNAVLDEVDLNAVLERVDVNELLAHIDLDAVLNRIDVDALLDHVDLNTLLARVDVDGLLEQVDVNRLAARLDLNQVLATVDMNRLMGAVDVTAIVARVDVNQIVQEVDVDGV